MDSLFCNSKLLFTLENVYSKIFCMIFNTLISKISLVLHGAQILPQNYNKSGYLSMKCNPLLCFNDFLIPELIKFFRQRKQNFPFIVNSSHLEIHFSSFNLSIFLSIYQSAFFIFTIWIFTTFYQKLLEMLTVFYLISVKLVYE